jgi:adenosylhomocysteine nucleosidase
VNENIGLVFATKIEAKHFIKGFALQEIEKTPFKLYRKDKIFLVISGIGKSNAAMAASFIIWKYKAAIVFNIGAAGSAVAEKKIGDIYHIDKIIEYDRPKFLLNGIRTTKPDIIDGFVASSLATQDRPVTSASDRQAVAKYADLVDMEGAAVLQACRLMEAKCFLFKIVTDTPDSKEIEIIKNIFSTAPGMFEFFKKEVISKI